MAPVGLSKAQEPQSHVYYGRVIASNKAFGKFQVLGRPLEIIQLQKCLSAFVVCDGQALTRQCDACPDDYTEISNCFRKLSHLAVNLTTFETRQYIPQGMTDQGAKAVRRQVQLSVEYGHGTSSNFSKGTCEAILKGYKPQ